MVRNVHERTLPGTAAPGPLLDTLSASGDRLWPWEHWPAMRLDPGLRAGAVGGHGPVRYAVESHLPGEHVRFRFLSPAGFDGYHEFRVLPGAAGAVVLRHVLVMRTHGWARLSWPLVYRPLHDAVIEDALHKAAVDAGLHGPRPRWSPWVRLLRRALSRPTRTSRATAVRGRTAAPARRPAAASGEPGRARATRRRAGSWPPRGPAP